MICLFKKTLEVFKKFLKKRNKIKIMGGKDQHDSKAKPVKGCPETLLSGYPVLYPTQTNLSFKSFKSAVNFNSIKKAPCKNTWYRDLKSTHIRNKQLLEFPLKLPKCCFEVYNANVERRKQERLKKFGLTLPKKVPDSKKTVEDVKVCGEEEKQVVEEKIIQFPECYQVEDDSDGDEDDEYKTCSSGSESECSGCSTLGGGTRKKLHKVVRKDWRELLYIPEDPCKDIVLEEMRKHKSKQFFDATVTEINKHTH